MRVSHYLSVSREYEVIFGRSVLCLTTFFFVFVVILILQPPLRYRYNHRFFFVISSAAALDEEYVSMYFLATSYEYFLSGFSYLAKHRFFS